MRRSVRLSAALLALMPLIACSLIVDTAGLGEGAGGADGASDTAVTDARITEDAADGSSPADATTDTNPDAPDGGAACVDGPTRFCDDFDSPSPGSKWLSTGKRRGEITFEDVGLSLPRAMHAKVLAGSGTGEAALVEDLPGNPASVRCELDLKLDGISLTGETDVITFVTTVGGVDRHAVYLSTFGSAQWVLAEFAAPADGGTGIDRTISLGAPLPNATWFHVAFEVHPAEATITANGAFIKLTSLSTPAGGTAHKVGIGLTYADSNVQTGGVFVDNVDCTALP